MQDKTNLHLKVQELIDCFASTDPVPEMSKVPEEQDVAEGALKWLALAILHGVNANAKKISLKKSADGMVSVTAKYREADLPSPGPETASSIVAALRDITHIEDKKGKLPLAIGLRDSSIQVQVKVKSEKGKDKISIKFPEPGN